MRKWLKRLILAFQFMTRIPIPVNLDVDGDDLAQSMIFYPIVGLAIGTVCYIAYYIFGCIATEKIVPSIAAIIIGILITGAFHIDGFADVCDALLSNKDASGMLSIMKDSRIGTGGAVAVTALLLFDAAMLIELRGDILYKALLLTPIFGRASIPCAAALSSYAREEGGLGRTFIDKAGWRQALIAMLIAIALGALIIGYRALILAIASTASAFGFSIYMKRKIGGMTGDTLGATCEIAQAVVLLCFVALY